MTHSCLHLSFCSFLFSHFHLNLKGSQRISDSEISDYDCEDGVGVITGKHTNIMLLFSLKSLSRWTNFS